MSKQRCESKTCKTFYTNRNYLWGQKLCSYMWALELVVEQLLTPPS